jgi:hypothetical protein
MLAEAWQPGVSVYENAEYIRIATLRNAELEATMLGERDGAESGLDRAWAPPPPPEDADEPEAESA